jgi:MoxR-like ATPase
MSDDHDLPTTAGELEKRLAKASYVADPRVALTLLLALRLGRPVLIEGPAGVGKTDLARAAGQALSREVIRLQCYEGLDEGKALYEWDYAKQLLMTQLLRDAVAREIVGATDLGDAAAKIAGSDAVFFSERFLIARPILRALRSPTPAILLLDEVDRADPEFEAFLLEVLAEQQITIPELGTIRATHPPLVLLTTNGTREMTDALRRRCLHLFVDYPPPSRELTIVELRVPGIERALSEAIVAFVARLRGEGLRKAPSISETIDWARALVSLGASHLGPDVVESTLSVLTKYEEDREKALALANKPLRQFGPPRRVRARGAAVAKKDEKPAPASAKPVMPQSGEVLKSLGIRLGLPLLAAWIIAGFVNHWIGYAVVGSITAAAGGLAFWAWRRLEKTKAVANILGAIEPTDKAGRQAAIEKLDKDFKKGDLAATFAKSQLMMQDDPDAALRELETIDLAKALPAEADQARFQRALIHLTRGEVDAARKLVDPIDLTRHEDARSRAMIGAVVAEAWGRTGQAKRAKDTLELFDPEDASFADIRPQLWRARAFVYASLNDMKQVRRALKKLSAENPQYLSIFLVKKVHPLLEKEAKQMLMASGAVPRRQQYSRRLGAFADTGGISPFSCSP